MVSTLNQMVNYIPLRHFEFKEVVNITVTGSDYANNAEWDKNLVNIYKDKSIANIEFSQTEITDITAIKRKLDSLKTKKVFWNITGGQRPFVLAINQIAKDDDVIC